jgi:gluconate 2-dehydrogenase alpha chain
VTIGPSASSPDPRHPDEPRAALTPGETATLSALMERLFPADDLGPGAVEIGVVDYLVRAFAGPYNGWLPVYRRGLAALDAAAQREHGLPFAGAPAEHRDAIIAQLERRQVEELEDTDAEDFFEVVWQHLREGLFSDPIHGGNRQMLGWRLIGFPGAQYGYTAEDQQLDVVITREPRSVADLRSDGGAHDEQ